MINLNKYHKQTWRKEDMKQWQTLNKEFKLNLDLKNDEDVLYCQVFALGLENKARIEQAYEAFRSKHLDMWEHMNFQERTFFSSKDLKDTKASLLGFDFEDKHIKIPFFNKLLNHLYLDETPILELPQFFNLYHHFTSECVDIKTEYQRLPLKAGMSKARFIMDEKDEMILFAPEINCFYKLDTKHFTRYPLYNKVSLDRVEVERLAKLLLKDEFEFYKACYKEKYFSRKALRKVKKKFEVKS